MLVPSWGASQAGARAKLGREQSWGESKAGARAKLGREQSWGESKARARAKNSGSPGASVDRQFLEKTLVNLLEPKSLY
jgi:hypothetical protein